MTGKESVAVYMCPSCGATASPVAGSVMPRPCPRCLETTGRAVEMVPNEHSVAELGPGGRDLAAN